MVAQLNRQADWVENGERIEPRMSMIKGSGTIEQASSRVLLLSEKRVTPEVNEIIGVLDKNDSGDRGLIQFGLYKNPYIFREIA
jgi:replicative DNA helicase